MIRTISILAASLWLAIPSHAQTGGDGDDSVRRVTVGQVAQIATPAAMITYGIISLGNNGIRRLDYDLRNDIVRHDAFWHSKAENYAQFAPAAAAFALKGLGVRNNGGGRGSGAGVGNGWGDMAARYILSNAVAGGIVTVTKHAVGRLRPDGSNNLSFPSGHTETAFVAAEFLHQEYRDKSVWISVAGYGTAAFVGAARIMNDHHWLSDVIAGAGVGILSTKAVYWGYPYLRKALFPRLSGRSTSAYGSGTPGPDRSPRTSAILMPGYSDGALSINFACVF